MDTTLAGPWSRNVRGNAFRSQIFTSKKMMLVILVYLLHGVWAKGNGDKAEYRTAYACEGRHLRIGCEGGHLIHLLRANYGRFSISICNEHGVLDWSVDCTSPGSFKVIKDTCGMKNSCSLSASPNLFGDPCPGTPKYLEAHYQCVPEKSAVTPSTSTTTSTSSTTSTSRPSIIIPVTRNARPPHHVLPPSPPPSSSSLPPSTTTPVASSYMPPVDERLRQTEAPPASATRVTTLLVDATTTLADSLMMVFSGTPEASTSEPSTVHLSRWSPDNHDEGLPVSTMSCAPTEARGLFWNWTRAGHVALHRCPGGGTGRVKWRCDSVTVQWYPETPDFSDCTSQWVDSIRNKMQRGDPITSVAAELAAITKTKTLLAGDIVHTADILHRLVAEMAERTRENSIDPQDRKRILLALLKSVLKVSSNLLNDEQRLPWQDLTMDQQQKSASALLRSQEKSGWLLAESYHSRYSYKTGYPYVLAAVHVIESWDISDVVLPPASDTTWWTVKDRLFVPAPALLATAKQGVSRLVLLVHQRLGDLLGSEVYPSQVTNVTRVVNSRVIGALLEGHHVLSLPKPITVTFKHLQVENVSDPLCVFWDYQTRSWSQEGCWQKFTNRSHTICQCNHLTNLAVIMSVTETQEQAMSSDQETLRMIVYIGCAIAMVFLLITLLVLQFIRCLRTERVAIHKHLCLCLLLAEAALVGGLEQTEEPRACSVLAGLLHYLLLAAFAWAFLDSFHLYVLLGESDPQSPDRWRVKWYSCVAYGVPAVVVAVSALVDPASYGTDTYCWLRVDNYYVFSFGGPAIACAVASILFLCMTVGRICAQRNSTIPIKSKDQSKLSTINIWSGEATVLLLVLCSTWTVLPIFLHDEKPVSAYFFLGLNILLGILVFLFYCLNSGKIQNPDEPPGPDWLCSCLKEPPRRRSLYSPPGSCPHNVSNPLSHPHINNPTQTLYPDRHFGNRSSEEHPLQYLLRAPEPQQQPWGLPDAVGAPGTLCCYHQNHHSAHDLKQQRQLQQQQGEPLYETLEPLEAAPRPLLSSLAAVLNTMGPGMGSSTCHVAYCGIQSPTDSTTDRSSSSFMDAAQVRLSPAASSPDNDFTDSLPNLVDKPAGCRTSAIPVSLTY